MVNPDQTEGTWTITFRKNQATKLYQLSPIWPHSDQKGLKQKSSLCRNLCRQNCFPILLLLLLAFLSQIFLFHFQKLIVKSFNFTFVLFALRFTHTQFWGQSLINKTQTAETGDVTSLRHKWVFLQALSPLIFDDLRHDHFCTTTFFYLDVSFDLTSVHLKTSYKIKLMPFNHHTTCKIHSKLYGNGINR